MRNLSLTNVVITHIPPGFLRFETGACFQTPENAAIQKDCIALMLPCCQLLSD